MVYRKPKAQPGFADLKGILAQSKQTDNPLYQAVQVLIERLGQFQNITTSSIGALNSTVGGITSGSIPIPGGGGGGGTDGGAASALYYDAPLSDGNLVEADLIFASGECIIVQVPV